MAAPMERSVVRGPRGRGRYQGKARGKKQEEARDISPEKGRREWFTALECPVCSEYMTAPIFQCMQGHSLCSSCKGKLNTCPCCKELFSEVRNFSLELISENMLPSSKEVVLPSRKEVNASSILTESILSVNRAYARGHLNNVYLCLPGLPRCRWSGGRDSLLEHVKENHPQYAWMTEDNTNTGSADFSKDKNVVQIISAHGEIFWYKLCIKSEKKTRYVSVHYIGTQTKCSEYIYEMAYVSESDPGYKVIFSAPTHPEYVEIDELIENRQCSSLHCEVAKHFLVEDRPNTLRFTLKISKK